MKASEIDRLLAAAGITVLGPRGSCPIAQELREDVTWVAETIKRHRHIYRDPRARTSDAPPRTRGGAS